MYKKVLTVWRVEDGLFRDGCVLGKKTDLKIKKYATGIGNRWDQSKELKIDNAMY